MTFFPNGAVVQGYQPNGIPIILPMDKVLQFDGKTIQLLHSQLAEINDHFLHQRIKSRGCCEPVTRYGSTRCHGCSDKKNYVFIDGSNVIHSDTGFIYFNNDIQERVDLYNYLCKKIHA